MAVIFAQFALRHKDHLSNRYEKNIVKGPKILPGSML